MYSPQHIQDQDFLIFLVIMAIAFIYFKNQKGTNP